MELARAGEALLRSSQPLLPFLAPAACRQPSPRVATISRHCRTQPLQKKTSTRPFTTSLRLREENDEFKKSEEPHPDSLSKQSSSTDDISSLLDSTLDFNKGTPTTPAKRTTRFASNTNQHNNSPSRAAAASNAAAGQGSSMDDMLSALLQPASSKPSGRSGGSIGSYLDPKGNSRAPPPAIAAEAPMKLGPTLGRTVYVDKDRGFDVARAFRTMEIQVARNAVRRDFNRQRFHERGGMKRKRLKSERWRRRFKEGFRAVVRRVLKMRKQGW